VRLSARDARDEEPTSIGGGAGLTRVAIIALPPPPGDCCEPDPEGAPASVASDACFLVLPGPRHGGGGGLGTSGGGDSGWFCVAPTTHARVSRERLAAGTS
jgi:hypothetical protein